MGYTFETVADKFVLDLGSLHHLRYVIQVTQLTGLIDPVGPLVEPFGVVELQTFLGGLEKANEKHEGDD
jgi:hypothetical protein